MCLFLLVPMLFLTLLVSMLFLTMWVHDIKLLFMLL
jgi:hypothetical protein